MAPKRNVTDVRWVDKNIVSHIPAELLANDQALAKAIETWNNAKDVKSLPTLSAGSLYPQDVFSIFNLRWDGEKEYELENEDKTDIPEKLDTTFTKFKSIIGSKGSDNEALARCFINFVIFSCILEEHTIMQAAETNTPNPSTTERAKMPEDERNVLRLSTTRHSKVQVVEKTFEKLIVLPSPAGSKPGGTDTTSEQSTHTDIGIYFEPEIRQNVKFKEVEYSLSGFADYALGHRESGIFSGNLIIVEAKRRFQISSAYGQLLACMAMTHRARKNEKKENAIVYGVATDGFQYHFWLIDNQSTVSSNSIYHWMKRNERAKIYSTFRAIIRVAALSSPTTSLVKKQLQEVLTQNLTGVSKKFDFGVSELWNDIFTSEDDPDVNMVFLPDVPTPPAT